MKKLSALFPWILAAALLGVSPVGAAQRHTPQKPAPAITNSAIANDFPTQARVEYVAQCMAEHGEQNLDNMYHCVCAVDKIAAQMKFQDYSEALTFTYMYDLPGEKGGEFRDPPKSKIMRDKLKAARKDAESCFPVLPGSQKAGEKP